MFEWQRGETNEVVHYRIEKKIIKTIDSSATKMNSIKCMSKLNLSSTKTRNTLLSLK